MWVVTSKISKRLLFDALLWDVIITGIFAIVLIYLGNTELTVRKCIGVVFVIIGMICVGA